MPHPPVATDGDDFQHSHVGYYEIIGNKIRIELFALEDGGDYKILEGTITENGISFRRRLSSLKKSKRIGPVYTYSRAKVGPMRREPNW